MANKLKSYLEDPFLRRLYTDIRKAGPLKSISVDIMHTCNIRCTGIDRDCDACFDTWEHFPWVTLNLKKRLVSKQEFTNWLTTMYLFYMIKRIKYAMPALLF